MAAAIIECAITLAKEGKKLHVHKRRNGSKREPCKYNFFVFLFFSIFCYCLLLDFLLSQLKKNLIEHRREKFACKFLMHVQKHLFHCSNKRACM